MNKERVGCNGCEMVSTQNEGGEGVPALCQFLISAGIYQKIEIATIIIGALIRCT